MGWHFVRVAMAIMKYRPDLVEDFIACARPRSPTSALTAHMGERGDKLNGMLIPDAADEIIAWAIETRTDGGTRG